MDEQNPLEQAMLGRELVHEDGRINNAVKLLPSEFQPTVPVKVFDNVKKLYEMFLKPKHDAEPSSKAVGMVPYDKSVIYFNRNSAEYGDNNPYILASKLAHEQFHVTQPRLDRRESPAYERELEYVNKNPLRFDKQYRLSLADLLDRVKKSESPK